MKLREGMYVIEHRQHWGHDPDHRRRVFKIIIAARSTRGIGIHDYYAVLLEGNRPQYPAVEMRDSVFVNGCYVHEFDEFEGKLLEVAHAAQA